MKPDVTLLEDTRPPVKGIMERLAEQKRNKPKGAIYYVSAGHEGPIKIGFAGCSSGLSERLRGLQTACPYHLVALAAREGSVFDEGQLHERFAKSRLRGEWFMRTPQLMKHIEATQRRKDCQKMMRFISDFCLPEQIVIRGIRGGPDERRQMAMFGPYADPPEVRIV
ncbi:GIY-YIG nuclease family protein [Qipengyuania atrilutea]|uniref:GIY-YIG nuclease family protein n=1 Tax=Qipengyuania atrilutea TaxID=2744473 RepID=A0A850H5A2_9SPHN|nr:GIY-YIG nuclease family protein [Actirhodobacter atriluteus]NVD45840.1 GIY-YIG nuclease family protein [Actirhodobacter atriluteus]